MKVARIAGLALGPLLAATLRDHKTAIAAAQRNELDPMALVELTAQLALAAARRVDPNITMDQIENVVDVDNAPAIFAACWGVAIPEPAPGEAPAVENPSS